jgi:hypothetical protein
MDNAVSLLNHHERFNQPALLPKSTGTLVCLNVVTLQFTFIPQTADETHKPPSSRRDSSLATLHSRADTVKKHALNS